MCFPIFLLIFRQDDNVLQIPGNLFQGESLSGNLSKRFQQWTLRGLPINDSYVILYFHREHLWLFPFSQLPSVPVYHHVIVCTGREEGDF